jgi:hypothetical protein
VALRQELNKHIPDMDLIESVSIGETGMTLATMTYLNKEFYAQMGLCIGDNPHGVETDVWVHPQLRRH